MLKAVVFDFDGTLTPNIRPSFQILEDSGLKDGASNPRFFKDVRIRADRDRCDIYEAMAKQICDIMTQGGFDLTDENISRGADQRIYNPGVDKALAWLKQNGVKCYLISAGLRCYLQKIAIAPYFDGIYATTFRYGEDDLISSIEHVMNTENKAVALGEIAQEVNGNSEDFQGIVYIGDGATDLIAMQHIKKRGGSAILVHLPEDSPEIQEAQATGAIDLCALIAQAKDVADLYALADYTESSEVRRYLQRLSEES